MWGVARRFFRGVQCGGSVAVGRGVQVRSSAVGSSTRAANRRKRRTKGSSSTMSREANVKLWDAAERGDVGEMERLIAAGANPNAFQGSTRMSPLLLAAQHGHVAAIAVLLKAGAHVDGTDIHGDTALMLAARHGRTAAVDALIALGADVHRTSAFGDTALHRATAWSRLDATRVLLEAGATVDVRNNAGKRPIDVVCCSGIHLINGESGAREGGEQGLLPSVRRLVWARETIPTPQPSGIFLSRRHWSHRIHRHP